MDIAAIASALSQAGIKQQASISVLKLAMNTAKTNGDLLTSLLSAAETTKLMEKSVQPNLGTSLDIRV